MPGIFTAPFGISTGELESKLNLWINDGGVFEFEPFREYYLDRPINVLRMNGTADPRLQMNGNGATIRAAFDVPPNKQEETLLTLATDPSKTHNNEHGFLVIDNIRLLGPRNASPIWDRSRQSNLNGLSILNVDGPRLRDVHIGGFSTGLHMQAVWPASVRDCRFAGNYFNLVLDSNCTCSVFDNVYFGSGWVGFLIWPGYDESVFKQTFNACIFEGLRRIGILNAEGPRQSETTGRQAKIKSKALARHIAFRDCYQEPIQCWNNEAQPNPRYKYRECVTRPILIGKADLKNWNTDGVGRPGRKVSDLSVTGGYWQAMRQGPTATARRTFEHVFELIDSDLEPTLFEDIIDNHIKVRYDDSEIYTGNDEQLMKEDYTSQKLL